MKILPKRPRFRHVIKMVDDLAEGLLLPGATIRGYLIVRIIRSGQSNNVYAAISPDGQDVAIKEYFPRRLAKRMASGRLGVASEKIKIQFESGVKGFISEAVALAEIRSDLLAKYVGAFRENGTAYLITALEPGDTLEEWSRSIFRARMRPTEADLRYIFWTLLNAVQVMHERGFLHLDIKPSNVIMRDVNTPILIDLGGARRYPHSVQDVVSASNYTPGFAAPEQHAEQLHDFGPCTDIYGVGSSILYCMTGRVPPLASLRASMDTIEELFDRCSGFYSEQFITIVRMCLSLDVSMRCSSVKQLQNLISSH